MLDGIRACIRVVGAVRRSSSVYRLPVWVRLCRSSLLPRCATGWNGASLTDWLPVRVRLCWSSLLPRCAVGRNGTGLTDWLPVRVRLCGSSLLPRCATGRNGASLTDWLPVRVRLCWSSLLPRCATGRNGVSLMDWLPVRVRLCGSSLLPRSTTLHGSSAVLAGRLLRCSSGTLRSLRFVSIRSRCVFRQQFVCFFSLAEWQLERKRIFRNNIWFSEGRRLPCFEHTGKQSASNHRRTTL